MKRLKLDLILANIFVVIFLIQGINLIKLKNYEIPVIKDSIKEEKDLGILLNNIENKDCTILNLEYKEGWTGDILFKGSLDDLDNYINSLKSNNIYVKDYKIEKSEELKCFLEFKAL